jgi:hypothetical protein
MPTGSHRCSGGLPPSLFCCGLRPLDGVELAPLGQMGLPPVAPDLLPPKPPASDSAHPVNALNCCPEGSHNLDNLRGQEARCLIAPQSRGYQIQAPSGRLCAPHDGFTPFAMPGSLRSPGLRPV